MLLVSLFSASWRLCVKFHCARRDLNSHLIGFKPIASAVGPRALLSCHCLRKESNLQLLESHSSASTDWATQATVKIHSRGGTRTHNSRCNRPPRHHFASRLLSLSPGRSTMNHGFKARCLTAWPSGKNKNARHRFNSSDGRLMLYLELLKTRARCRKLNQTNRLRILQNEKI